MSTPFKPVYGVISVGGTVIGAGLVTASRARVEKDVDVFYAIGGSGEPQALLQGRKNYTGRFSKAFIDTAYANLIGGTAEFEITFYPAGTASGKPKITFNNAVFTSYELTIEEDAVVAEDLEFTAKSVSFGTVE
jgi:hypothetical protein